MDLFNKRFNEGELKMVRCGWPMEYMVDTLASYKGMPKKDIIVFPHRIATRKTSRHIL